MWSRCCSAFLPLTPTTSNQSSPSPTDSTSSVPPPYLLRITSALDTLSPSDFPSSSLIPTPPKPHTERFQRDFLSTENLTSLPVSVSKYAQDKVQTPQRENDKWVAILSWAYWVTWDEGKFRSRLLWVPSLTSPPPTCTAVHMDFTLLTFHFFTNKMEQYHNVLHVECAPC